METINNQKGFKVCMESKKGEEPSDTRQVEEQAIFMAVEERLSAEMCAVPSICRTVTGKWSFHQRLLPAPFACRYGHIFSFHQ